MALESAHQSAMVEISQVYTTQEPAQVSWAHHFIASKNSPQNSPESAYVVLEEIQKIMKLLRVDCSRWSLLTSDWLWSATSGSAQAQHVVGLQNIVETPSVFLRIMRTILLTAWKFWTCIYFHNLPKKKKHTTLLKCQDSSKKAVKNLYIFQDAGVRDGSPSARGHRKCVCRARDQLCMGLLHCFWWHY